MSEPATTARCRRNDNHGQFSYVFCFFFSSRRRHTILQGDWSSDVCSSDLAYVFVLAALEFAQTRLPARRHLSGVELAWACRDFALEQFGMLASAVLTHWGINTTDRKSVV